MAPLRLMSLAGAALLLTELQGSHGNPSFTQKSTSVSRLAELNRLRDKADLGYFSEEKDEKKKLPIVKIDSSTNSAAKAAKKYEELVCEKILAGEDPATAGTGELQRDGSFAFAPQSGAQADCNAAIDHWLSALESFDGVPPEYEGDNKAPYDTIKNRSLVALLNPNDDPTVDCAYFVCKEGAITTITTAKPTSTASATQEATTPPEEAQPQGEKAVSRKQTSGSARRLSASESYVGGLVCVTYPKALTQGHRPFEKDEWDDIVKHINASNFAPTATAVLFTLAASALSVFDL